MDGKQFETIKTTKRVPHWQVVKQAGRRGAVSAPILSSKKTCWPALFLLSKNAVPTSRTIFHRGNFALCAAAYFRFSYTLR
jgi:hypothetical protein